MNFKKLRQKTLMNVLLIAMTFAFNGCIYLVVGGVGALGGYVVSPDTVEGMITNENFDDIWDAVVEVVSVMGFVQERNDGGGILIAKVQGTKVTVSMMRLSDSAIKVSVKARKAFMPKVQVAQEVYMKIIKYISG